jgi:hypothetical protein
MSSSPAAGLAARLHDLTALLTAPGPVDRTRYEAAVIGLLRDHVPGVVSVSVTRGSGRSPVTAVSTDRLADRADRLQYETAEGPCLHAMTAGEPVVLDLAAGVGEQRWPRFRHRLAGEPTVGGVLSLPLCEGTAASLNVYLGVPGPDHDAVAAAAAAARLALTAVATRARADQLTEALASSRTIGAAIGVLMARRCCTQDVAFRELREASQNANRKLRDVADDVVATGELPVPGRSAAR